MPLRAKRPSDQLMSTLTGHRGSVHTVAISPDGSWLATASYDKTPRVWDADGAPPQRGQEYQPEALRVTPGGRPVVAQVSA
jgi:WD40 repeat protein